MIGLLNLNQENAAMWPVIQIIIGFALLIAGADFLVRGASQLAKAIGMSSLVIGLTIVAYGTGAPELAVGINAGLKGQTDLVVGNAVGSNIFNILAILGVSALAVPLIVAKQLVRLDVPIMIGIGLLLWILCLDGTLSRGEGLVLFLINIVYTIILVKKGKRDSQREREENGEEKNEPEKNGKTILIAIGFVILGLALLGFGSQFLIEGAVTLAKKLGVSELLIGLTIVAIGTGLPELATSVVAGLKGERDIAVGNIVGSNIFNILAALGVVSLVSAEGVVISRTAMTVDIPIMIAAFGLCLPIFYTGYKISRFEGALFLTGYVCYMTYLVMDSQSMGEVEYLKQFVKYGLAPVLGIYIAISLVSSLRSKAESPSS